MFRAVKKVVSVSFLTLTLFGLSGCLSTTERQLSSNNVVSQKVTSSEQSITERQELVGLLVENFAIQDYLNMAKSINKNRDEAFSQCVITDDTYDKTKATLEENLFQTISSLTDSEVTQYINFIIKNDTHLFREFNKSIYSAFESDTVIIEIMSFYKSLNTEEIKYLMSINDLPNNSVRTALFPLDFPNFNLTLAGESIANMRKAVESSCQ